MDEIKPCPFCGSDNLKTQKAFESSVHPGYYFPEHVGCKTCGVEITGGKAFIRWNARANQEEIESLREMNRDKAQAIEDLSQVIFNSDAQKEIESLRSFIETCNLNMKMCNDERESLRKQLENIREDAMQTSQRQIMERDEWKRRIELMWRWMSIVAVAGIVVVDEYDPDNMDIIANNFLADHPEAARWFEEDE